MLYQRFTALADRKKGLRNDEIAALARDVAAHMKSSVAAADRRTAANSREVIYLRAFAFIQLINALLRFSFCPAMESAPK